MSLGLVHARALQQVLRATDITDGATEKVTRRFAEVTMATVEPLYRATLAFNRHRLAEMIGDATGRPYDTDDPSWAVTKALAAASRVDPDALRTHSTLGALLATPAEVFAEPMLAERILALGAGAPRYPTPGPSRRELLDVLHRAGQARHPADAQPTHNIFRRAVRTPVDRLQVGPGFGLHGLRDGRRGIKHGAKQGRREWFLWSAEVQPGTRVAW